MTYTLVDLPTPEGRAGWEKQQRLLRKMLRSSPDVEGIKMSISLAEDIIAEFDRQAREREAVRLRTQKTA